MSEALESSIDQFLGGETPVLGSAQTNDTANSSNASTSNEGEVRTGAQGDTSANAGDNQQQQQPATQQNPASNGQGQRPASEQRPGNAAEQQQQQQQQAPLNRVTEPDRYVRSGVRYQADRNGNLIDPATNRIVAAAGNERRYFEAARNATTEIGRLRNSVATVTRERDTLSQQASLPRELGLNTEQVSNALRFMAHWNRDPVAAGKNMLAELLAMGHTIEGLGAGIDTAAIQRMVQGAVQPFVADRAAQQTEQQNSAQVQREIDDLFSEFPWAEHQQDEVVALLKAQPGLTMREATLMLQAHMEARGYDPYRSATEQLNEQRVVPAATQEQQQQVRSTPATNPARGATPPAPSSTQTRVNASEGSLPANATTRDIVAAAMREAGFQRRS